MKNTTSLVSALSLSLLLLLSGAAQSHAQTAQNRRSDLVSITGGVNLGAIESQLSVGLDIDARYYREGRHGVALRFTGGTENIGEARYSLRFATHNNSSQHIGLSANIDLGLGGGTHRHGESFFVGHAADAREEDYTLLYGVAATTGTVHFAAFSLGLEFGVRAGNAMRTSANVGPRLMKEGFADVFCALRLGFSFDI